MKKNLLKWSLVLMCGIAFSACEKDPVEETNEEEVITTMQLTFAPLLGGNNLVYKFEDLDGFGGSNPTVDVITLAANTSYNVTLQLLNKSETPAEDITTEVAAESQSHRFYYQPSVGSNITVSNLNTDAVNLPLGITSTWTTTAAATGNIKITLRHYPGNPPGKAADDAVNSTKSATDIEVDFNTIIQ